MTIQQGRYVVSIRVLAVPEVGDTETKMKSAKLVAWNDPPTGPFMDMNDALIAAGLAETAALAKLEVG